LDEDKPELEDVRGVYTDTWDKIVKAELLEAKCGFFNCHGGSSFPQWLQNLASEDTALPQLTQNLWGND